MKPALDVDGAPFPCTTGFLNPEDPIPEYRNNPLIGALGPVADAEARFDALYEPPPYDVSACNLAPHLRAHVVRSLSGLLVPMPAHDRAQQEIDIMVRRTYLHRNILSEKYRRQVRADRDLLLAGSLPPERFANSPLLGAAVLGPPGVGKTTLMRLIVSQHPQVIHHAYELNGVRLACTQVVHLTINLFQDASLKAFAVEFFDKLGAAIQNPELGLQREVQRCNGNTAQPLIYQAAREFNLGLLVIDDSQNMVSNNRGYKAVLDYFVRMMNCLGLAVVLIGTNRTQKFLEADATFGRRFISNIPILTPMRPKRPGEPDGLWEIFLATVWRYRFVRTPSDFYKFSALVYELTGGIPDLVIKLYTLAQTRCFGRDEEEVTAPVLTETAAELFSIVGDRIKELKGLCDDTPGIEQAKETLRRGYESRVNEGLAKAGAAPAFEAAKPSIEVNASAETKDRPATKPSEDTSRNNKPPEEHPLIVASRATNIKDQLASANFLEVIR